MSYVFIDGVLQGTVKDAEKFVKNTIKERRAGKFSKNLNILYNEEEDIIKIKIK